MAIAFRASSEADNGGAVTTLVIDKPTGVVEGDLMLACVRASTDVNMSSAPSGWTLYSGFPYKPSSFNSTWMYYKVAGASEPSTYTWTIDSGTRTVGNISAYQDAEFDTFAGAEDNSDDTPPAPTVSVGTANSWAVLHGTSSCFNSDIGQP